jgi:hypothetical protein
MGAITETSIIIEELSRDYKLLGRHKFQQKTIHIGRGYQNDIIVTDEHVCPEHLNITFNGEHWVVADLETVNGSYISAKKQAINEHVIHSGDVICIGKSKIRVLSPQHPVEQSIIFSPFESIINFLRQPVVLFSAIALFICFSGYLLHLNDPKGVDISKYVAPAIGMALLFAIWPIAVSIVSHLTKNDARLWHQLAVSFVLFNLFWLTDFFESILKFNTSNTWPTGLFAAILPIVISFSLFWFNSYIGFNMSIRRRRVIAASLTILLLGGSFVVKLNKKPEFSPYPHYDNTLMSPKYLLATPSSVNDFITNSDKLFEKTSKAALKD